MFLQRTLDKAECTESTMVLTKELEKCNRGLAAVHRGFAGSSETEFFDLTTLIIPRARANSLPPEFSSFLGGRVLLEFHEKGVSFEEISELDHRISIFGRDVVTAEVGTDEAVKYFLDRRVARWRGGDTRSLLLTTREKTEPKTGTRRVFFPFIVAEYVSPLDAARIGSLAAGAATMSEGPAEQNAARARAEEALNSITRTDLATMELSEILDDGMKSVVHFEGADFAVEDVRKMEGTFYLRSRLRLNGVDDAGQRVRVTCLEEIIFVNDGEGGSIMITIFQPALDRVPPSARWVQNWLAGVRIPFKPGGVQP